MIDDPGAVAAAAARRDELRIRIFTLADHAVAAEHKLYVNGSGVTAVFMPDIPGLLLAPLVLVVKIYVPFAETSEPHRIRVRLLTEDRQCVGPPEADPLVDITGEVGRQPGTRPGDESTLDLVFGLTGLPVQHEGRAYFHLDVDDGRIVDTLPIRFVRVPRPTAEPNK